VVDTIPPSARVLTPENGKYSRQAKPVFSGEGESGATVRVFVGNQNVGEALVQSDKKWSQESMVAFLDGTYSVSIEAFDPAGNMSPRTAPTSFIIDTVAPKTSIMAAPRQYHNSQFVTFIFESSEANSRFECSLDGGAYEECLSTDSFDLSKYGRVEGEHTLEVRAVDVAENADPSSVFHHWTVLITPPPPPQIIEPLAGASVYSLTPDVVGKTVPMGKVDIYFGDRKVGIAEANNQGSWSFKPSEEIKEGNYTVSCTATDPAGNQGKPSEGIPFNVVAPKIQAQAIGGGIGCSSSGALPSLGLLAALIGLWMRLSKCRR